jgi:hypothetical protein
MNRGFTFAGTAGYWVHERKQFKQSHRTQRILAEESA